MKKGKILFTGGNGFIGKQIIPLLENDGWEIIRPRSHQVRLEVTEEVDSLFKGQHFAAIIHGAIVGGRREIEDSSKVFLTNMHMFENIFKHIDKTDLFINFDSGASLGRPSVSEEPDGNDLGKIIPMDPYGFSKYCIAKRVLDNSKGFNLRIFGCFGQYESNDRFFAKNIRNYIEKKDINIVKDRKMDFIYANDLYKITKKYLDGELRQKDINCVYDKKYYLSELAEMINTLDEYRVNITKMGSYKEFSYCGSVPQLDIQFEGIEKGIRDCYEYFK
jgi:GDP-L-fucose synthase